MASSWRRRLATAGPPTHDCGSSLLAPMRSLVAPAYPIAGRCSDRSDVPRGTRRPTPGPSPAWSQRLGARRRPSTFPRCERRPAPEIAAVRSSGRHCGQAHSESTSASASVLRGRGATSHRRVRSPARTPATALPGWRRRPRRPARRRFRLGSGECAQRQEPPPPSRAATLVDGARINRPPSLSGRTGRCPARGFVRASHPAGEDPARRPCPDGTAWFRCRERLVRSPCQIDSDRRRRGPGCGTVGRSGLGLAVPAVELDPADGSAPRPAFTAAASAASHRYLGPPWVRPRSLRRMGRISWSIG